MIDFFTKAKRDGENISDRSAGANAEHDHSDESNVGYLNALSVVRGIVGGKLASVQTDASQDLVQTIALRLWSWRVRYPEKSERMTKDEWQKFAARTALNEVTRHFECNEIAEEQLDPDVHVVAVNPITGETSAETESLVAFVWQGICALSVRQRRALLLSNHELVIFLLHNKVTDDELSNSLEIKPDEWVITKPQLPLSDAAIAKIKFQETNQKLRESETTAKSIRKARHEARAKMHQWTKK